MAKAGGFAAACSTCRYCGRTVGRHAAAPHKEDARARFLTVQEYRRVGRELRVLEQESSLRARAAAALRLLMLTGCRLGEVLTLRWDDVDSGSGDLRLRDAKTGARMAPLTPTASAVLAEVVPVPGSPWIFTGNAPGRHLSQLTTHWHRVRKKADVEDVRIHDLRHTFASRALALGESLTMIGRLLGHDDVGSTARYAHLSRDAEKTAVSRVGGSIGADILRIGTVAGDGVASPAGETDLGNGNRERAR